MADRTPAEAAPTPGDEMLLRHFAGIAEPIETRRVERWRDAGSANASRYADLERIWRASAPPGSLAPPPPDAAVIRRRGDAAERRAVRGRFARAVGRREIWPLVAAMLLVSVGAGVWLGRIGADGDGAILSFAAGTAGSTVTLPDGGFVRLAPGSRLTFEETTRERRARLQGRALLAVASDPARPFLVDAGGVRVAAHGTRFDVAADGGAVRVALVDGSVTVDGRGAEGLRLRPGQIATLEASGPARVEEPENLWARLGWPPGVLVYHDTPLPLVAADLRAQFGVAVAVDPAFSARTVTAAFDAEPLPDIVETLCLLVEARCVIDGPEVRIGG